MFITLELRLESGTKQYSVCLHTTHSHDTDLHLSCYRVYPICQGVVLCTDILQADHPIPFIACVTSV